MAKGDDSRSRNQLQFQGDRGQALGENLRKGTLEPNVDMFRNYYTDAANKASTDYGNIMGQYQNFAKTGGYSPTDLASIRSRAISPTRAAYARGMENISRNAALQGGYSPGRSILQARLGREMGQAGSDAAAGAESNIAQMVNQGRQFGVAGQQSLYGTTPGAAATFGNQLINASGQLASGVGNEMGLGQDIVRNQIAASQLPGKGDYALSRIGQIANMASGVIYPFLGNGGGGIAGAAGSGMQGGAPSYASSMWNSGQFGQPGFNRPYSGMS